jgi:hypothetical protein
LIISTTFGLRPPANVLQKYDAKLPVSRLCNNGSKKFLGGKVEERSGWAGAVVDDRRDSRARRF